MKRSAFILCRICATAILSSIFVLFLSVDGAGQCDSSQLPTFVAISEGGNDTIPSAKIRPGFGFEMHHDSGHTMYRVAEFKKNGSQIWLHGWCEGKTIRDLSSGALSDSSRTVSFTVYTGDTITFFRELAWFNPWTMEQTPGGYYSLDTLDYAVELVKTSSGQRRALLDSIGVLKNAPIGTPTIYGTRPIIDVVKFIVPSLMNGETVFIRVRLYARGGGLYDFVRTDRWGLRLSDRLSDSAWQNYLYYMGGPSSKPVPTVSETDNSNVRLAVSPNPSTGKINIAFDTPDDQSPVALVVYDMEGKMLFIPKYNPQSRGMTEQAEAYIEESGTYLVALYYGRRLVRSTKIIVNK